MFSVETVFSLADTHVSEAYFVENAATVPFLSYLFSVYLYRYRTLRRLQRHSDGNVAYSEMQPV